MVSREKGDEEGMKRAPLLFTPSRLQLLVCIGFGCFFCHGQDTVLLRWAATKFDVVLFLGCHDECEGERAAHSEARGRRGKQRAVDCNRK